MAILLINICKEPLHYFEFVRPVEDILKDNIFDFLTKHYSEINEQDIKNSDKIIICGTSLADNKFIDDIDKFKFLLNYNKPVLGICGGAHIIGLLLGYKQRENKEVGMKKITLNEEFLGVKGDLDVYFLHQFQILPEVFHKDNFFATLFHPEVRNKEIILNFSRL